MIRIPVEISARHVHLMAADWQQLFSSPHPTMERAISQRPQFVAHERIHLVGPKGELQNVGIVGPLRPYSQVELSRTDAKRLGIEAPLAESGHLEQAAQITLRTKKAQLTLPIAIVAHRHIHAAPGDADKYGLRNGDELTIMVGGPRGGQLDQVIVRIHPTFTWSLHLDTDEANALGLQPHAEAEVIIHV